MSTIPSYLFSSGLLPFALLAIAILLVAPATALGSLFGKGAENKRLEAIGDHGSGAPAFRDVCI